VHEQNAAPGRLNLLVGRLADRVFLSFPDTLAAFPVNGVLSGYPLRRQIQTIDRDTARASLDFAVPAGRLVVFAFGGSQGARTINRAIVDALGSLLPHKDRVFIIHGTGLADSARSYDAGRDTAARLDARYSEAERRAIETFYVTRPFFHDIERVYAVTGLAVVRGGAGTLNELASLGLPAIVVPKVNLPGEHQVMNARALERAGGAVVLYEETRLENGRAVEELDGSVLASAIVQLLDDAARLSAMALASRQFIQHDAIEVIRTTLQEEDSGRRQPVSQPVLAARNGPHTQVVRPSLVSGAQVGVIAGVPPLLSPAALLPRLERAWAAHRSSYRVEIEIPAAGDRTYYVSRATSLLSDGRWELRNLGVKLVGLLQARDKLPLVLALFRDRRPAAWYKRLLGGDFEQVGFIRRNAVTAIGRLAVVTPDVEDALLVAMSDPYYEVRSEAARVVAVLESGLSQNGRSALVAGLVTLLTDRWLEVVAASADALGRIGGEHDARPVLLALESHRYWVVRAAALRGLASLVERGCAGDLAELEHHLRRFVLTATDFRPEFAIRTSHARVIDAIQMRRGSTP
jgi:UDP-N-acetylglucosamine--N-acetylmuramyl-(pentapeptide) pyrophosphoryl-undecaprenol N-acetylglucosamine transferase